MSDMRMTATDASRDFSALLSRVASGETVEIERHSQLVAVVTPPRRRALSGAAFIDLVSRLPHPDDRFADDVRGLAAVTSHPGDPWAS
jgi:prevent-host-death family protein